MFTNSKTNNLKLLDHRAGILTIDRDNQNLKMDRSPTNLEITAYYVINPAKLGITAYYDCDLWDQDLSLGEMQCVEKRIGVVELMKEDLIEEICSSRAER